MMCGYRDDYGRANLENLTDSALYRAYGREVAPSRRGRDRAWIIDRIVERRRERSVARGDFRSKYYSARSEVKRDEKRIRELEEKLERETVERRHAVELAGALLRRMDKMKGDHMDYDTDLYAPLADDDSPLACMARFGCDDDEDEDDER